MDNENIEIKRANVRPVNCKKTNGSRCRYPFWCIYTERSPRKMGKGTRDHRSSNSNRLTYFTRNLIFCVHLLRFGECVLNIFLRKMSTELCVQHVASPPPPVTRVFYIQITWINNKRGHRRHRSSTLYRVSRSLGIKYLLCGFALTLTNTHTHIVHARSHVCLCVLCTNWLRLGERWMQWDERIIWNGFGSH